MRTLTMNRAQLDIILVNGRWFAGFICRYKLIGTDRYNVKTNYVPAGL